jgi:O-antigen/teichoic acid export membrane protein
LKASSNFLALISVLTLPLVSALFPAFSKFEKKSQEVRKFFGIATMYATTLVVPSTIVMAIFSKELIEVVYGFQWISAPAFLSLNVMLYLLVGLGYLVQDSFFNGIGETFTTLKMALTNFLLFIALSPFLTMYFSVQGLIGATLISNIVATIYGAYKAKNKFKVEFYFKKVFLVYLAAVLSAAPALPILILMPFSSLLKIAIASSVYLIFYITPLPLLSVITKSEIEKIKKITTRIPLIKPLIAILLEYEKKIAQILEVLSTKLARA